ncbi:hypothetical protein BT96DRAFT_110399 [Gymnopus androsaceus JB14]|uniref:Uncharacterized protein n=1 Tax=Gymnopus androsaceus JB14 TaxID=1447944 RepID=A0A6A4GCI0_9AGAR|nr:hypothetical protein BT96DRAFT_110399 [Gymnopus androsaceus JB14]
MLDRFCLHSHVFKRQTLHSLLLLPLKRHPTALPPFLASNGTHKASCPRPSPLRNPRPHQPSRRRLHLHHVQVYLTQLREVFGHDAEAQPGTLFNRIDRG